MQIFDADGKLLQLDAMTSALVDAVLNVRGELVKQGQGVLLLNFSPQSIHLTLYGGKTPLRAMSVPQWNAGVPEQR